MKDTISVITLIPTAIAIRVDYDSSCCIIVRLNPTRSACVDPCCGRRRRRIIIMIISWAWILLFLRRDSNLQLLWTLLCFQSRRISIGFLWFIDSITVRIIYLAIIAIIIIRFSKSLRCIKILWIYSLSFLRPMYFLSWWSHCVD